MAIVCGLNTLLTEFVKNYLLNFIPIKVCLWKIYFVIIKVNKLKAIYWYIIVHKSKQCICEIKFVNDVWGIDFFAASIGQNSA